MSEQLTCGSLFSGVGGMDIGFAWAGWRHAFFAEIEPFGRAVLAARFPGVPIYSDVRDVPECGSGIPWGVTRDERPALSQEQPRGMDRLANVGASKGDQLGDVADRDRPPRLDVLTFGSPCQDLSVAGKRRGLDGDRSGLFWEAMRIAGDGPLRPRALLMENVEGLLSSNGGRDFALVLDAMAERGYRWSYRVLDSQHFGVAQRRRRVFVVAIADDDPRAERIGEVLALTEGGGGDSPTREPSWPDVAARVGAGAQGGSRGGGMTTFRMQAFGQYESDGTASTLKSRDWKDATDLIAVGERERERVVSAITQQTPARPDDKTAQAGHLIVKEKFRAVHQATASVRRLTPMECERLQGWPDGWTDIPWNGKPHAPDSKRYAAAGNGVTATVAYWIAARLAEVLK